MPKADALVVYGASFHTLNKWALGISDTLALGLLCEYTGLRKPILAIPVVRQGGGLDAHPAFAKSVQLLREYGVHLLSEPEAYPPRNEVPREVVLDELHTMTAQADAITEREHETPQQKQILSLDRLQQPNDEDTRSDDSLAEFG